MYSLCRKESGQDRLYALIRKESGQDRIYAQSHKGCRQEGCRRGQEMRDAGQIRKLGMRPGRDAGEGRK